MRGSDLADQATLDAAVAKSILARMPDAARAALVSGATRVRLDSKAYFVRSGDAPRCGIVVSGMVRTVRTTRDGRELTLQWGVPGAILGLTAVVHPPPTTSIQAVSDSIILDLPLALLGDLASTNAKVGWAVAEQLTLLVRRAVDEIVLYAYGDLRTRIERRLLEFACKKAPGTPLIAELSQDDLAQAVGAARPSVARVLKDLREEGSIRSFYGGVLIVRPEALAEQPRLDVAEQGA